MVRMNWNGYEAQKEARKNAFDELEGSYEDQVRDLATKLESAAKAVKETAEALITVNKEMTEKATKIDPDAKNLLSLWSYETASDDVPSADAVLEMAGQLLKKADYLKRQADNELTSDEYGEKNPEQAAAKKRRMD